MGFFTLGQIIPGEKYNKALQLAHSGISILTSIILGCIIVSPSWSPKENIFTNVQNFANCLLTYTQFYNWVLNLLNYYVILKNIKITFYKLV